MMKTGIKSIVHTSGKLYPTPSDAGYIILESGIKHHFKVEEWFDEPADTAQEKVIWRLRSTRNHSILKSFTKRGKDSLSLTINKKLSGRTRFYLEAASGATGNSVPAAGLYVAGYAKPLITKAFWTKSKGGSKFEGVMKYGEIIHLYADTEGLNGNVFVVEVYLSNGNAGADDLISSYPAVNCENGEFDLKITNTLSWYSKIKGKPGLANFFVRIRNEEDIIAYLKDSSGSSTHARFLRIERKINKEKQTGDANLPVVNA